MTNEAVRAGYARACRYPSRKKREADLKRTATLSLRFSRFAARERPMDGTQEGRAQRIPLSLSIDVAALWRALPSTQRNMPAARGEWDLARRERFEKRICWRTYNDFRHQARRTLRERDYQITLGLSSATAILCVSRLPPASFYRDLVTDRPLFTFTEFPERTWTHGGHSFATLCATPA
jgi:hypothetical protein